MYLERELGDRNTIEVFCLQAVLGTPRARQEELEEVPRENRCWLFQTNKAHWVSGFLDGLDFCKGTVTGKFAFFVDITVNLFVCCRKCRKPSYVYGGED